MISNELKEKLLNAKTFEEFQTICKENGNPLIKELGAKVCRHFGNLMSTSGVPDYKDSSEAGDPREFLIRDPIDRITYIKQQREKESGKT